MALPLDAASMFSVKGKVAVITGGGSGLGQIFAETLVSNGAARVYIVGRRQGSLDKVVQDWKAKKQSQQGDIIALQGDVSTKESILKIVDGFKAAGESKLDILINSAGVMTGSAKADPSDADQLTSAMWDLEPDDWKLMYDVNVISLFYTTVAFAPLLKRSKEEHAKRDFDAPCVLNIASIAGYQFTRTAIPGYQASKAAVLHLSDILCSRLMPHHIRVNCIAPGLFPSEMTQSPEEIEEKMGDMIKATITTGRAGLPHEIAAPALLLCSRAGGYMNGSTLTVDGGRMMIVSGGIGNHI